MPYFVYDKNVRSYMYNKKKKENMAQNTKV